MSTEVNTVLTEVLDLLSMAADTAALLKQLEYVPKAQRRMFTHLGKLLRMVADKVVTLPHPTNSPASITTMSIMYILKTYRDSMDRAYALNELIEAGCEVNVAVFLLDLVYEKRRAEKLTMIGDYPVTTNMEVKNGTD